PSAYASRITNHAFEEKITTDRPYSEVENPSVLNRGTNHMHMGDIRFLLCSLCNLWQVLSVPWNIRIQNGIKSIAMADPGPNAMDGAFLNRLVREIGPRNGVDGVILTGNGRFFSAGLNLVRLVNTPREEIKQVITAFSDLLTQIMTFSGPVIAVVNGHAVGGGCLLALSCDTRIGTEGNYKMGINEFDLGVPLPPVSLLAIRKEISSERETELMTPGILFPPEEALAAGLLDELTTADMALAKAHQIARRLSSSLRFLWRSKREQVSKELEILKREPGFPDRFADQWMNPATRRKIKTAVQKLKKT
ncbi:MAG: enoyl-CoA hydratase/isomerase family protein, partial [Fidelibacterota bacterium]